MERQDHRQERSQAVDGLLGLFFARGISDGPPLGGRCLRLCLEADDLAAQGLAGVLRDRWACYISVAVALVLPRRRRWRCKANRPGAPASWRLSSPRSTANAC